MTGDIQQGMFPLATGNGPVCCSGYKQGTPCRWEPSRQVAAGPVREAGPAPPPLSLGLSQSPRVHFPNISMAVAWCPQSKCMQIKVLCLKVDPWREGAGVLTSPKSILSVSCLQAVCEGLGYQGEQDSSGHQGRQQYRTVGGLGW